MGVNAYYRGSEANAKSVEAAAQVVEIFERHDCGPITTDGECVQFDDFDGDHFRSESWLAAFAEAAPLLADESYLHLECEGYEWRYVIFGGLAWEQEALVHWGRLTPITADMPDLA